MDDRRMLPGLALQFATACCLCTVWNMLLQEPGLPLDLFPLVLLPFAPAVFLVNRLFLRRQRSMLALILLNAALVAAVLLASWRLDGFPDGAGLIFQVCFCVWPAVSGANGILRPVPLRTMIVCVDISVVLLLIWTGYLAGSGASPEGGIPMAAGLAAAVLGLVLYRTNRVPGLRDWGMIGLAFAGILAGTWLLLTLAAPTGMALVRLWETLVNVGRRLLYLLLWLLDKLFQVPPGDISGDVPLPEIPERDPVEPGDPTLLIVLGIVGAIALVAFLVWNLLRMRVGGKVGGKKTAARTRRHRLSLWEALKRLRETVRSWLQMRRFLRREKNTPAGLFYILVRRCRLGPWRQRPGETPRAFLCRLRESAAGDPELATALETLTSLVEEALFAPDPPRRTVPEATMIRRKIRRAVMGQFLREQGGKLRVFAENCAGSLRKTKPRSEAEGGT